MRKIMYIVCLILWSINAGISVVNTVQGVTVNPVTVLLPSLVCVILYAERLREE